MNIFLRDYEGRDKTKDGKSRMFMLRLFTIFWPFLLCIVNPLAGALLFALWVPVLIMSPFIILCFLYIAGGDGDVNVDLYAMERKAIAEREQKIIDRRNEMRLTHRFS